MKQNKHKSIKIIFRTVGIVLVVTGIVLILCGMIPFFKGDMSKFFLCFIGFPLLFVGLVLTILGFMREASRYIATEQQPVAKDVANYMIDGTRDEIVKTVNAVRKQNGAVCPACGTQNEPEAQFCDNCGNPLSKTCGECGEQNDGDANFCRKCGSKL